MINFRNLSNATKNEAKHQENLAKEHQVLASPLTYITPRENDGNMQKLNRMVGLNMLKTNIEKHLNMVRMMKWRMDKGMETSMPPLHMVFLGNPGKPCAGEA